MSNHRLVALCDTCRLPACLQIPRALHNSRFELRVPRSQGRGEGLLPLWETRPLEVMPLGKGKLLSQQTPQGRVV